MSDELNQKDETVYNGKVYRREPSEGWSFVMLIGNQQCPRLNEQPAPKTHLAFHRAEEPDGEPVIFTLMGKDETRKEAYYMRGMWEFGTPPSEEGIFGD